MCSGIVRTHHHYMVPLNVQIIQDGLSPRISRNILKIIEFFVSFPAEKRLALVSSVWIPGLLDNSISHHKLKVDMLIISLLTP